MSDAIIPEGWVKLGNSDVVQTGDKIAWHTGEFFPVHVVGKTVGEMLCLYKAARCYIRKAKK